MLVRFTDSHEIQITGDEYHNNMCFSFDWFNNDTPRQMLYGYLEVFDQFKVILMETLIHFKTSAEFTHLNTDIPTIYHAYDPDMNGRYCACVI